MAVRVKLKVRGRELGATVETVALVNSGYEVEEPEMLLPKPLAEYLNLPLTPPTARTLTYETPFGIYRLTFIAEAVDVELSDVGVSQEKVHCTISPHEREVLLSDQLSEALGIAILNPGRGFWMHTNDAPNVRRKSEKPEYW